MEKYEVVREIGSGNFGVAKLMRNKDTQRLLVIKFIQRGHRIDENVFREILNHRALRHPNIIRFEEVVLTPTHLGIVMEYAEGGDLFDRIDDMERFHENEARYFFQQLVCGVSYCHAMHICHRDLKLENTLLHHDTRRSSLCLKICDFGYSKSWVLDSRPKSTVGTPAYIAPEVLSQQEYDGTHADVWSCGVILYVMLVGGYPFEDTDDPKNFHKTIARIKSVQYKIPDNVHVSDTCCHLLSRILVADPRHRITMAKIKAHPWYLNSLPSELRETAQQQYYNPTTSAAASSNGYSMQSVEEIIKIVQEAKKVPKLHNPMYLDDNQRRRMTRRSVRYTLAGISTLVSSKSDKTCLTSIMAKGQ